jgi:ribonucleoside-diphosphate reductase alpha chain
MLVPARDYTYSYFAFRTLERSYLLRDAEGRLLETPQDMAMRVAVAVHMDFHRPAAALDLVRETYELTSGGFFTHATPTLFNAGTEYENMVSCYLLGTEDSMGGIYKTLGDCAQISKWAGGIGVHVSNIRARGAKIRSTNGTADGLVPMLKVFNETARYCNQAGRRKGSIAVYLEPWHADVWEFCELRRNSGAETERARDLFLALWVPDLFMEAVRDDGDWHLMTPDVCPGLNELYGDKFKEAYEAYVAQGKYVRRIRARELWYHVMDSQIETGTPYILFKDHVNRKSNHANVGIIKSSNLCAEITEFSDSRTYACCNLASIAVNRFVVPAAEGAGARVDHERLHAVTKVVVRNLDRIIDNNYYPTKEARASNLALRPVGVGIQGMGDLYCLLELPYDSEAAVRADAEVMETIYHAALEASVELAQQRGAYSCFRGSPFSCGRLQLDAWPQDAVMLSGRYDWDALRARVQQHGTRNSLLTALMPTASTSQIMGNAECFEPINSNIFKRGTLAGEFLVVNRHLMRRLMTLGLWTPEMKDRLLLSDGSIKDFPDVPEDVRRIYRTVWELPQRSIIDHAAARGPFVDQSQSMNLYFATPNYTRLHSALMYAWQRGLKTGVYYVRSKPAKEAIKFAVTSASASASAGPGAAQDAAGSSKDDAPACTMSEGCVMCSA